MYRIWAILQLSHRFNTGRMVLVLFSSHIDMLIIVSVHSLWYRAPWTVQQLNAKSRAQRNIITSVIHRQV